jgi:hypothetical protein
MPRIERDPRLEIPPNFASAHYDPICAIIVNTGATEEEALTQITGAWQQENEARREAWDLQIQEDQVAQEEADQLVREIIQEEEDTARREHEKKRPKINDFDTGCSVGAFIAPRPSTYAINKLESFDYIELFYFTREGCLNAQSHQRTEADDTFGLSRVGDHISFRSISAVRSSKNVIQDIDLSWNQLTYAKSSYLQHLSKAGWPQKHVDALAHFFIALESSAFCARTHGEKILITYQARVRRHWHDQLKHESGTAFNIALIDDSLLETISNEMWDVAHAESKREVSTPSHLIPSSTTNLVHTLCTLPICLDLMRRLRHLLHWDPCYVHNYLPHHLFLDSLHHTSTSCYIRITYYIWTPAMSTIIYYAGIICYIHGPPLHLGISPPIPDATNPRDTDTHHEPSPESQLWQQASCYLGIDAFPTQ